MPNKYQQNNSTNASQISPQKKPPLTKVIAHAAERVRPLPSKHEKIDNTHIDLELYK